MGSTTVTYRERPGVVIGGVTEQFRKVAEAAPETSPLRRSLASVSQPFSPPTVKTRPRDEGDYSYSQIPGAEDLLAGAPGLTDVEAAEIWLSQAKIDTMTDIRRERYVDVEGLSSQEIISRARREGDIPTPQAPPTGGAEGFKVTSTMVYAILGVAGLLAVSKMFGK